MARDDNNWDNKSSSSGPAPATVEDARRQYEKSISSNLNNFGNITTSKDGHSRIFGVEVPKSMRPVIELTIANVLPYLTRHGSEAVYKKSSEFATKLNFKDPHNPAWIAENVFRWGLIGAKPISDVVSATNQYAQQRKELFTEFAPVMEATKANYKNNEVIKVAYDGVHSDMMTNMRMVMADLPTLVPQVIFGLQDQADLKAKREKERPKGEETGISSKVGDAVKKRIEEYTDRMKGTVELSTIIENELDKFRIDYIKKGLAEKKLKHDGSAMSAEELGKFFDKEIKYSVKSDLQYQLRAETDALRNKEKDAKDKKQDEKNSGLMQVVIPVTSSISQIFKASMEEGAKDRAKHVNSWQMIKNLKQEMDQQCANRASKEGGYDCDRGFSSPNPDEITVPGIGAKAGQQVKLKDYILDVFQQHERDRIGENDKFDAAGRPIDPLGPALVARLRPAVDKIAEYVADGRLDTYALVNLVGENKIIEHRAGGAKSFANEQQVQKEIDNLLGVMSSREAIKPEEFFANFPDPAKIQVTLKKTLETMKGEERALFAAQFPDDILEQSGIKKSEIVALRKDARAHMHDVVAASVLELAEKDPAKLKELGLSEKDVQLVTDLASKVKEGDTKALETAVDGRDKSVIAAIRTASLNDLAANPKEGESFWSKRVKEAGNIKDKIKNLLNKESKETSGEMAASASEETKASEPREFLSPDKMEKPPESFVDKLGGENTALSAREREANKRNASDPNNMLAV